jgi:hypothetical protein
LRGKVKDDLGPGGAHRFGKRIGVAHVADA